MIGEALGAQLSKSLRYVQPVPLAAATGLTAEVYRQLQTGFMPGPVLTLHSPAPQVMAGQADRASKE